jgi:hypothetical protein
LALVAQQASELLARRALALVAQQASELPAQRALALLAQQASPATASPSLVAHAAQLAASALLVFSQALSPQPGARLSPSLAS